MFLELIGIIAVIETSGYKRKLSNIPVMFGTHQIFIFIYIFIFNSWKERNLMTLPRDSIISLNCSKSWRHSIMFYSDKDPHSLVTLPFIVV